MIVTVKQAQEFALAKGLDITDSQVLLCYVLGKPRSFLYTWPEAGLSTEQYRDFNALVDKRLNGEPVAYLTGVREFWSLPLKTSPVTLIPRPDTERLVEVVLETVLAVDASVIDLGCGTGAIALALKSERTDWHVVGVDRVPEAVALAEENAAHLNLDVRFSLGNWLSQANEKTYDVIVSNPPYIDASDPHLQQGDVRFEPHSALVAEDKGLADIREIINQAKVALKADGYLFFEHGWQQAVAVQGLLADAGFIHIQTVQDYGGNDRVTFGQKPLLSDRL